MHIYLNVRNRSWVLLFRLSHKSLKGVFVKNLDPFVFEMAFYTFIKIQIDLKMRVELHKHLIKRTINL